MIEVFGNLPADDPYRVGLDCYGAARSRQGYTPSERYALLERGLAALSEAYRVRSTDVRRLSLAAVADALGLRAQAMNLIGETLFAAAAGDGLAVKEPFLPLSSRWEKRSPRGNVGDWLAAMLLETLALRRQFSTFFEGENALDSLALIEEITRLEFSSPEIERRRQLLRLRRHQQAKPESAMLLSLVREPIRNAEFWCQADRTAAGACSLTTPSR
ncbi:MAG: hypothetical protein HY246_11190 [Proteobacteria bacterium]|nr:hypothetical protein [Pseudomonadota bacterium]